MSQPGMPSVPFQVAPAPRKVLLHVGCGPKGNRQLNPLYRDTNKWREVRLDLDPTVKPDIVCSFVDMRAHVPDASADAIWSSHNIEHLFDHEVPLALAEFVRVLKPGGYTLIRTPDLNSIVEAIVKNGLEFPAYMSPAGPITPLDMLYGHRPSIARGNTFMAHHTAFTDIRLANLMMQAGFAEARTRKDSGFDLWAVGFTEDADVPAILADLEAHGLSFRE